MSASAQIKLLKKLGITLVLLTVMIFVIAYMGREMIKSSPVYDASRLELQRQYGVSPADLSIRYLWPFKFTEGESSGLAEFVICTKDACYQVKAQKKRGAWNIATAKR